MTTTRKQPLTGIKLIAFMLVLTLIMTIGILLVMTAVSAVGYFIEWVAR